MLRSRKCPERERLSAAAGRTVHLPSLHLTGVPTGCLISIFLAGKKKCKQSNPCFFGKHTAGQIYVLAFLLMSLLMIADSRLNFQRLALSKEPVTAVLSAFFQRHGGSCVMEAPAVSSEVGMGYLMPSVP